MTSPIMFSITWYAMMTTNGNGRKEFFVDTVRNYLKSRGLEYSEYEAPSGSVYFHVAVKNRYSAPCIRVSDHLEGKRYGHALTLLYTEGKNTPLKKIKQRICRSIDNMIAGTNAYSTYRCIEEICKKEKNLL